MLDSIRQWLLDAGLTETQTLVALELTALAGILLLAVLANFIAKKIIVRIVHQVVKRTKTHWDDILVQRQVFERLSHLAPALVIWILAPISLSESTALAALTRRVAEIYMLVAGLLVVYACLDAGGEILRRFAKLMRAPVRVYVQVAKILVAIATTIFALSITLGKSPWVFLSGLGAISAVMLLIFKDSILGLVAGVQLSANDMVQPGDWIQMPQFGADGDVMEVSLTTVKVRNWDKTISTIPTYALVSNSFKNWRGMEMSGGRRIKRTVFIDVNSIRFLSPRMIEKLARIDVLKEYISAKQKELAEYNEEHGVDDSSPVNGRRLTNVGTFRAYLVQYLRRHPSVHQEMTFLVRHLQPTEKGLPIEIYVFSTDQRWVQYEAIQADIIDHVFAVFPEFELRPFQLPSGADFAVVLSGTGGDAGHQEPATS
jgi:miniconductance mechanosensitive channel